MINFKWLRWTWVKEGYLKRMPLLPRNKWCKVYLHRYFGDDDLTYGLHDHPWNSVSFKLNNKKMREIYFIDNVEKYYPQHHFHPVYGKIFIPDYKRATSKNLEWMEYRDAAYAHAIAGIEPGALTLFIAGPRIREWGFWSGHWDSSLSTGWEHSNSVIAQRMKED